jgi:hypothetical protein
MANYRIPADVDGPANYIATNGDVDLPAETMDDGKSKLFQIQFEDIAAIDQGVVFKFYAALDKAGLLADNIAECMTSVSLTGLLGNNVFKRELNDNLDDHFRVVISGADPASLCKYVITARSL